MSRGLAARLAKLERGRMSPQARVARMSDEALAAEIDRLFPAVVAGLMQGSDAEQARPHHRWQENSRPDCTRAAPAPRLAARPARRLRLTPTCLFAAVLGSHTPEV